MRRKSVQSASTPSSVPHSYGRGRVYKASDPATPPGSVSWRGSIGSCVEERTLLSTIPWAADVSGDWDNPSMWTGGVVPGPSDDAVVGFL